MKQLCPECKYLTIDKSYDYNRDIRWYDLYCTKEKKNYSFNDTELPKDTVNFSGSFRLDKNGKIEIKKFDTYIPHKQSCYLNYYDKYEHCRDVRDSDETCKLYEPSMSFDWANVFIIWPIFINKKFVFMKTIKRRKRIKLLYKTKVNNKGYIVYLKGYWEYKK